MLAGCGAASEPGPPAFTPVQDVAPAAAKPAAAPAGRYLTARVLAPTQLRATPGGRPLHWIGRADRVRLAARALGDRPPRRLAAGAGERAAQRQRGLDPRARAVRLGGTDWSIHVDRSARRLTLRRGSRAVRSFPVAVGRPGTETPTGRFAVTDKLRPGDPASPYGCCLLALSGHQTQAAPGLAGRRPPGDPRDAEPLDRRQGGLARLHARAAGGHPAADAHRAGGHAGVRCRAQQSRRARRAPRRGRGRAAWRRRARGRRGACSVVAVERVVGEASRRRSSR